MFMSTYLFLQANSIHYFLYAPHRQICSQLSVSNLQEAVVFQTLDKSLSEQRNGKACFHQQRSIKETYSEAQSELKQSSDSTNVSVLRSSGNQIAGVARRSRETDVITLSATRGNGLFFRFSFGLRPTFQLSSGCKWKRSILCSHST